MRIANIDLQPSGPTDMTTSFNMPAAWLGHIANYSIQLVFTGSPNGSFSLQASNDPGQPNGGNSNLLSTGVVNWTTIANSTQGVNAAGDLTYTVENAGYAWVRVVWTATSGSGTLTSARINVKGV